ncbi:MAG: hypothetical protein ABJB76_09605 [Candidatus Nitrosocosmicus sp.]
MNSNALLPTFNKKINTEELYENLLVLDSDEGIRIENSKSGEKIFINRNLLGTYCILIRIKKNVDNQNKEKNVDEEINDIEYTEQFFNHNEIAPVLDLIKNNIKKFDIWTY